MILKSLHERSELLFISHTQDFNTILPLLPLMAKNDQMTVESEAEKIEENLPNEWYLGIGVLEDDLD